MTKERKAPAGVICLVSALSFHRFTDEIPRQVDIALLRGSHANKIKYPPVKYYRFDPSSYEAGIETYLIGRHKIKVYSVAKTIADSFKFRNKIGSNIALSALKTAVADKRVKPNELMQYAKICRVDRIIKPMLEALL